MSERIGPAGDASAGSTHLGVGASGLPRLNLYASGRSQGHDEQPGGEIQAFMHQRSIAAAPARPPHGAEHAPQAEPPNAPEAPTEVAAEHAEGAEREAEHEADATGAEGISDTTGSDGIGDTTAPAMHKRPHRQAKAHRPPHAPRPPHPPRPPHAPRPPHPPQRPHKHLPPAVVTHQTGNRAPAGADTRTTVGVGESVTFGSKVAGDWTADLVKPGTATAVHATQFSWQAPSVGGTATISFDPGGGEARIDTAITIIAPAVEYRNPRPVPFPGQAPGVSGASMETDVVYTPDGVSFANTLTFEQPGPGSGGTGYFAFRALPSHHPNPLDVQIGANNSNAIDTAGFWGFEAPYSDGFFEWVIPTFYRVAGDADRHLITYVHQTCTITADGSVTVTKGALASVTRAPT